MLHDHILVFLSFRGYSNMQIITTTKQMAICIFTTSTVTRKTIYTVTHFEFELVLLLNNNSTRKTNVN